MQSAIKNIKIICVGSLTESYHREILDEKITDLKGSVNVEITYLDEVYLSNKASMAEIMKALDDEAQKISFLIKKTDYLVVLDIGGRYLDSESFLKIEKALEYSSKDTVVFVVGSSYGLAESLKSKADASISMGKITMNHQFVPMVLLDMIKNN